MSQENYTSLRNKLNLENLRAGSEPLGEDPRRKNAFPLSLAHTGTKKGKITIWRGGRLLKTSKCRKCESMGGGKRGAIKGYSRGARWRLFQELAKVNRDAPLPLFLTLTYPDQFPSVMQAKYDLKKLIKKMIYKYPQVCGFKKLEPQERGAPHFHFLIWGVDEIDLLEWVIQAWFEIAGQGDVNHKLFHAGLLPNSKPCVSQVRSWRGVMHYSSKYLGKTFDIAGWENQRLGRFWGKIQGIKIPIGEKTEIEENQNSIILAMRLQRRLMKIKGRDRNSLTSIIEYPEKFMENVNILLEDQQK